MRVGPLARSKEANGQERSNAYTHLVALLVCSRDIQTQRPELITSFDYTESEPSTYSCTLHTFQLHVHQYIRIAKCAQ